MIKPICASVFYEDNNGGDIIEVIDNGNGTFTLQVGNWWGIILRKTGTISEITDWLMELVLKLPKGVETVERW